MVTALESTSVVRAPQFPVVTGPESAPVVPHPPAPTAPQSECDDEACRRHKQKPDSCVEPEYEGSVETNVDEWIDHLSAPPFATNTNTVHRIGARLRPVWGQCRVTACRTQANRFFHVKCLKCGQSVFGS